MTCIAQIFKVTHREQKLSSSLQNFKHILRFKMELFKCTEHGSLHKTTIWHKVTCSPFQITAIQNATTWADWPLNVSPGQTIFNHYHFSQEVSTKRPKQQQQQHQFTVLWAYFCSLQRKCFCYVAICCPNLFGEKLKKKKNKNKCFNSMCVYLQIFLCMWTIWRILYNLNYFNIMAKHSKDHSSFHYAQQCVAG